MQRWFLGLVTILFATTFAAGQDAKPQPTPPDDVVKITTNLIQVDVTVTDSKGKVVTDLKPEEIEIYENGEKQKITNFSFISSSKTLIEKPKAVDRNAIPIPQTVLRPEQIRRTIALVVDDLSLSFESAHYTRRALKKFVDEQMQNGDLVSIVRTGSGIGALQQFTSDKRMLYAAIEKVKWNPMGTAGISAFAPIEATSLETLAAAGDDTVTEEQIQEEKDRMNAFNDFRSSAFVTGTLGALQYIVTGMGELPGRKSVILFSDGFRLFERDHQGVESSGRVMDFMRQLVDLANRSSVVFYTVDPRGLQTLGLTAADNTSRMTRESMSAAVSERRDQLFETQSALSYLARETGGFAVLNNNDLSGGVRRVLEDQSYYLVAYEPDSDTFDPAKRKFNRLDVKVLRKGVNVRYRSGFFNIAERQKTAVKAPSSMTPLAQLETALISPFAVSGITLRLNALFGSTGQNSPYVRSLLHVEASDLKFADETDGAKKAVFDVLATSFGDNGQLIDQIGKTYTLIVKPEVYAKILAEGFVYHFKFPVKKPGAYQYRVAIRDVQSERLGSASQFIEVPDLKKNRLTLSSIVLENLTPDEYKKTWELDSPYVPTDPMTDTALRRVKLGSVLRFALEIYNAKLNPLKQPSLQTKLRVFRDGKLVLDGQQKPFEMLGQTDMQNLRTFGAISIGNQMEPGDYILQVVVTDALAKIKQQIATQFVQFEVVP